MIASPQVYLLVSTTERDTIIEALRILASTCCSSAVAFAATASESVDPFPYFDRSTSKTNEPLTKLLMPLF